MANPLDTARAGDRMPERAPGDPAVWCGAQNGEAGPLCTRSKNHAGQHVAQVYDDTEVMSVWSDGDAFHPPAGMTEWVRSEIDAHMDEAASLVAAEMTDRAPGVSKLTGDDAELHEAVTREAGAEWLSGSPTMSNRGGRRVMKALHDVLARRADEALAEIVDDPPAPTVDGDVLADVVADTAPDAISDDEARAHGERVLRELHRQGVTVTRGPSDAVWTPPEQPLRTGQRITTRAELERVGDGGIIRPTGWVRHALVRDAVSDLWWPSQQASGSRTSEFVGDVHLPAVVLDPGRTGDPAPAVGEVDLIDGDGTRWTETRPDHWHFLPGTTASCRRDMACPTSDRPPFTRSWIASSYGPVGEVPREATS